MPEPDPELRRWIDSLPLLDVAESWGIRVETYGGKPGAAQGYYRSHELAGKAIALGVQNLSTWAHELVHAADDRLGKFKERGQHWRSETVAELGGATLLACLGLETDADLGGCWRYVSAYARDADIDPVAACSDVLTRICDSVALILETAEGLAEKGVAA